MLPLPLPQLAMKKEDDNLMLEMGTEMFRIQEQLARLQTRLEDRHHTKAQAEARHRQAQDQLEAMKSQYSIITSQDSKAKANGETDLPFGSLALVLIQDYILHYTFCTYTYIYIYYTVARHLL